MATLKLTMTLQRRYLHIPICNNSPKVILQILAGSQLLREFSVELAQSDAVDWWAFYEISSLTGKPVDLISLEELPDKQIEWLSKSIQQSDSILHADDLYHEKYRPQFHFTSKRGWNNDPNGLVYDQGAWHMFYQHNPFGIRWGNMHWGHAISPDLVHWNEQPEAIFQKSLKDMAFSGGGFIDEQNSAGWQAGGRPPLIVAFTSTGRGECLAYSLDKGRTLVEYTGNPVISHHGRDPKIIWYAPGQHWTMIVYEELRKSQAEAVYGYAIYTSQDLKHWVRQSFLPGWYECPELFEMPVENQSGIHKWVIYGCVKGQLNSAFVVGNFDGKVFTPETQPMLAHAGPCFYAAQIFSQAPDHRKIMIGWLKGADYPEMPFSQGMSVPLELSLRATQIPENPYRLCFNPVTELDTLITDQVQVSGLNQAQVNEHLSACQDEELLDIQFEFDLSEAFSIHIGDKRLDWNPVEGIVSFAGKSERLVENSASIRLQLLIDRSVTEVFVNEGQLAFAAATIFQNRQRHIEVEGMQKTASLRVHNLKSIWQ